MAAVNRKCFRELTRSAPASPRRSLLCCLSYNLQSQARGTQEEQRSPLPSWSSPGGCGLPPLLSPFFWCYRVVQSKGALVILLVPKPICGATLGKSLSFSGPYFPLLKNELPPSTLLAAIQNSLVGGAHSAERPGDSHICEPGPPGLWGTAQRRRPVELWRGFWRCGRDFWVSPYPVASQLSTYHEPYRNPFFASGKERRRSSICWQAVGVM